MAAGDLNLLKLSVGTESVEALAEWFTVLAARNSAAGHGPILTHTTRMWPRKEAELLAGGSIYWVIRGNVLCRQKILRLDPRTGADGIRRCAIVLDPQIIRTTPQPRRAFQGWRYLKGADAPADTGPFRPGEETLPPDLESALARFGVL